jgi:hypothetical protein
VDQRWLSRPGARCRYCCRSVSPGLGITRSRTSSGRNVPAFSAARRSSRNPGTPMRSSTQAAVRPSTPGVFAPRLPAARPNATISVAGSCTKLTGHRTGGQVRDGSRVHCDSLTEGGARLCPSGLAASTPQTFPAASQSPASRLLGVPHQVGCAPLATHPRLDPAGRQTRGRSARRRRLEEDRLAVTTAGWQSCCLPRRPCACVFRRGP